MAIAGHVSRRMLHRYSHVRMEAKRRALEAISSGSLGAVHVTNHVTKCAEAGNYSPKSRQAVERNGRPVGTRTPDLYRVKVAL